MEECRHIHVNGTKCHAAALRNKAWCYFHQAIYRERIQARQYRSSHQRTSSTTLAPAQDYGCIPVNEPAAPQTIVLPLIEDISSIQLAISRILHAIVADTIDPKRAGLLLYGLQIAAQNQPKCQPSIYDTVIDIGQTAEGIDVARSLLNQGSNETFAQMATRLRLNLKTLDELNVLDQRDEGEDQPENAIAGKAGEVVEDDDSENAADGTES